ncbi:hypothetical protein ACIO3O_37105 [Streptomyces sp. NPDC087440]|uniref:hypothetical protein n=1 Tax=Streptomyces sp. NPDC087440 TaxID=3365790 RepID=UPI00381A6791
MRSTRALIRNTTVAVALAATAFTGVAFGAGTALADSTWGVVPANPETPTAPPAETPAPQPSSNDSTWGAPAADEVVVEPISPNAAAKDSTWG